MCSATGSTATCKRGWRVTSPNLEQCGLLEIDYVSLDELCRAEEFWQGCHPALADAAPETREKIANVLLDYLRRELAIEVDYLTTSYQEALIQQSIAAAARALGDRREREAGARHSRSFPRSRSRDDAGDFSYLSGRERLRPVPEPQGRPARVQRHGHKLTVKDRDQICVDLFRVLARARYWSKPMSRTSQRWDPRLPVSGLGMHGMACRRRQPGLSRPDPSAEPA